LIRQRKSDFALPLPSHRKSKNFIMHQKVQQLAASFYNETLAIRRHLHQHPELSFQEKETAAFISAKLNAYGIPHQTGVAGHGIVALIEGKNPQKRCIALRADIDALPIREQSSQPYCSLNEGVMHACGHDAHSAILLSAGRILNAMKNDFEGTIKLLFQPAEEKLPGGAMAMIEAGVLHNPEVEAIIALHVLPSMESGNLGFRAGPFMASGDEVNITVKGKGGHAAMPDLITDTVLIASQIVVNLQQVVSRMAPPSVPTVLSFGRFIADGACNIIPAEVTIQGTFRTFDENWREKARNQIALIASHTAIAAGATAEVFIEKGYPVLLNNEIVTEKAAAAAKELLGQEAVIALPQRMTTEDFAWYSHEIPACFFRLGTANHAKGIKADLHTSTFDIDESSLETGVASMAWIALKLLEKE
jgi:amidohydrolase